jgi:DNA/RNA-binding domain of Phe-tRNA-synthetase-like protein
MNCPTFSIDDRVRALGVRGAYAILRGLDNATVDQAALRHWRDALVEQLRRELAPEVLEHDRVLAGFRALHDAVGRSNRRFPSSAEALAALFLRKGIVPAINPLVDLYNGVSLATRLSLGAHDLAQVRGDIALRFATGTERFVPLGATQPEPVAPGEYCYVDGSGEILCRLEHRQCERTRVTPATTGCFYILQGNAETSKDLIEATLARLVESTLRFCGGRLERSWIIA